MKRLDTQEAVHLVLSAIGEQHGMVLRRARKTHPCTMPRTRDGQVVRRWDGGDVPSAHRSEIAPGDNYVEDASSEYAYQSGRRYCAVCAVAAGLARWV